MSFTSTARLMLPIPGEDNDFCLCLENIDLLYQLDFLQRAGGPPQNLRPFFLSEDEIELRLNYPEGVPVWNGIPGIYLPDTAVALSERLQSLMHAFDLTSLERDILLTALLIYLSHHYALLPDNGLAEGISQPLLSRLFVHSQVDQCLLQSALHPDSVLSEFRLLTEVNTAKGKGAQSAFVASEAIWHFFCGEGTVLPVRYPFISRVNAREMHCVSPAWCEQLFQLVLNPELKTLPVIVVEGHESDDREQLLATVLNGYHYRALNLDADLLSEQPENVQRQVVAEIVRDACLYRAGLIMKTGGGTEKVPKYGLRMLDRLLQKVRLPLFILTEVGDSPPALAGLPCVHLSVPQSTAAEKAALLQQTWPATDETADARALLSLAHRYIFNPADITVLMQEAEGYRQIRDPMASLGPDDLHQALIRRSRQNFGKLAQRITPVRTFDDIILAPALKTQLNEILSAIQLRESVAQKHFSRKTGGKTGVSALFYGDSGTGKTLAAEVLAQRLGVDLVKVDISTVVNKYVGETEKNLSRIFDLAERDSGVLFFDEADALFGKRSETKDAHDRHANIEVSYLLQRLESYPGLVILATNNRHHLDSAFNRRFTFISRFTYPDAVLRAQMWRAVWPETLLLAEDIDFNLLGASTELTGANICNVALLAAIFAAEESDGQVKRHHIERAIKRELSKLGRLPL